MWLFDTNVLSEVIRKRPDPGLIKRLREVAPADCLSSVICRYELRYGAFLREDGPVFWSKLEMQILPLVRWIAMDSAVSDRAGAMAATLEREGKQIGLHDVLIAATAIEYDLTLVTRNTRHFARLAGLRVENWFAD